MSKTTTKRPSKFFMSIAGFCSSPSATNLMGAALVMANVETTSRSWRAIKPAEFQAALPGFADDAWMTLVERSLDGGDWLDAARFADELEALPSPLHAAAVVASFAAELGKTGQSFGLNRLHNTLRHIAATRVPPFASPSDDLANEAVRFAVACGGSGLLAADYALTGLVIPRGWKAIDAQQARHLVDGFGEDEYRDVAESAVVHGKFSPNAFAVALEKLTPAQAAVSALLFAREVGEAGLTGLVLEVAARVRARLAISMSAGSEAALVVTVNGDTTPYEFDYLATLPKITRPIDSKFVVFEFADGYRVDGGSCDALDPARLALCDEAWNTDGGLTAAITVDALSACIARRAIATAATNGTTVEDEVFQLFLTGGDEEMMNDFSRELGGVDPEFLYVAFYVLSGFHCSSDPEDGMAAVLKAVAAITSAAA